ncbi:substrate-binding domain-containing protein [Roseicitreum antarcticum]|uniref:Monosaccharide ABC transporter substrate-binding protein, CUT2 family n=1 Tax=Roseicitreum antarcticum TaxID=564137 RepID=A0A1H2Z3X2_9RHOB|nr:substrate-binding domain-containing protein [Roseicitreum antarcticum]SDX12056.1 monosaccharide ABC transporter substrate-binding protein, CUT2 family [Roseicitreum antarcticum]
MNTTTIKRLLTTSAALLALSLPMVAQEVPEGAQERGYFLLPELHEMLPDERQKMEDFMARVRADTVPAEGTFDAPLKIALMFPSLETSDAWARLNISTRARLEEMGIPFEITEFMIRPDEHDRQGVQVEQVLGGDFDYVVIGPSEYQVQKSNIARLSEAMPTLVMNVVNPFVDTLGTARQPITHVGFDHTIGAEALCRWVIAETGGEGTFALVRYIPGLIDSQRSDHFADCVTENSNMTMVDEFEANGDRELAFSGGQALLSRHPDLTMLHAGNTAVALGVLAAATERGKLDDVIINGWGGGADELKSIKDGGLKVTAFRVNDDWGVAVAEAIRAHAAGEEVPVVLAATIKPIDYTMSAEAIDAETDYAFRYSGALDR